MKKNLLLVVFGILWVIIAPKLKALPVIGGFIGFLEFLAVAIIVATILYHISLHLYLWYKAK